MKKLVCLLLMLLVGAPAFAACGLYGSGVMFGVYSSPMQTSDVLATGTITVTCDPSSIGFPYKSKITSIQTDGSYTKYLTNGASKLYYNVYLDSGRTTMWGDGLNGTSVYNSITRPKEDVVIFGSIFKSQNVSAGSYTDTPTVEIAY